MLLIPHLLARNKENCNIESRILIVCPPCTMILQYSAGCEEKIAVEEAVI